MKKPAAFWRQKDFHKTSGGRLQIVAGSKGYLGAGLLCARGAVVGGCGYVRWCVPEAVYLAAATLFVDGVVTPVWDGGTGAWQQAAAQELFSCASSTLVIGPGLGLGAQPQGLLQQVIKEYSHPLVLDADALHFSEDSWKCLQERSATILTPHPGEAARLLGVSIQAVEKDRREAIQELQRKSRSVVVLKGPHTLVASEDHIWENEKGSPTLATAGSGDVLAGLVGALLARGVEAFEAACVAVSWHGQAGQWLENQWGPQGSGAQDVITALKYVQKEWWNAHSSNQ